MSDYDKNAVYEEIATASAPIVERYGSRAAVVRTMAKMGEKSKTTYQAILSAAARPQQRQAHGFPEATMQGVLDLLARLPQDPPSDEIPREQAVKRPRVQFGAQKRARERWILEFQRITGNEITDFQVTVEDDNTVTLKLKRLPKIGETWITDDGAQAIITTGGIAVITTGVRAGQQFPVGEGWQRLPTPSEE